MSHPLRGPRLRVRRAIQQIQFLRGAEESFRNKGDYEIVWAEFNPKTGKDVYRLRIRRFPSPEWGVHIGEIAHNLRSALDGLVYQLARLTTDTPAGHTQFPIFLAGRMKDRSRFRHCFEGVRTKHGKLEILRGDGRSMIRELRPEHQALIERLQPYKRGRRGRRCPLYLLKEINNTDKHRLILVVGSLAKFVATLEIGEPTSPKRTAFSPAKMLKDGAKILEATPGVQASAGLTPAVAFGNACLVVRGWYVCSTLTSIAEDVAKIVEGFAPEFS